MKAQGAETEAETAEAEAHRWADKAEAGAALRWAETVAVVQVVKAAAKVVVSNFQNYFLLLRII